MLEPDLLLMDGPFSALDVFTAENVRTELMDLWDGDRLPTRGICIVTHNIEEAVLLTDRVVVLGANPGHIRAEIPVPLQRPPRGHGHRVRASGQGPHRHRFKHARSTRYRSAAAGLDALRFLSIRS